MALAWTLAVDRRDLTRTTLLEGPVPEASDGQVVLRVDRVGLTANNVTYALLGDPPFRYWNFFPTEAGLGIVPLWGFAEVVASAADGVDVGGRVYGYLPSASHLVTQPDRADGRGFRDASAHRSDLPAPYNVYALTTGDAAYEPQREDLQVLYRPLFYTSFMLADQLEDNGFYGAKSVAISSASSKTAYGAAFLLRGLGPELVGLTSAANVAFTESLGCYDRVISYDDVAQLDPAVRTTFVDVAGDAKLLSTLREHLGDGLAQVTLVGISHQQSIDDAAFSDPRTTFFFAPNQIRKRTDDWGRATLDERFADAWRRFAPTVEDWVDVVVQTGPDALRDVWLQVLAGQAPPRAGNIITF